MPPINVHVHDVPLTEEQIALSVRAGGDMFGTPGGITSRAKLSQLAKGKCDGAKVPTNKPAFIRELVQSWPAESTIVWTIYNDEQDTIERAIPGAVGIRGETPYEERTRIIEDFQSGRIKVLVTKAKVLGYGLNLQIATRQVFSGLVDSYESYYQAVKRSNRIGSTRPLNVHIPVTPIERPMIETVLAKAKRVQHDTEEQERIFKGVKYAG
jgi:superfamily II DNA or RNA helicase